MSSGAAGLLVHLAVAQLLAGPLLVVFLLAVKSWSRSTLKRVVGGYLLTACVPVAFAIHELFGMGGGSHNDFGGGAAGLVLLIVVAFELVFSLLVLGAAAFRSSRLAKGGSCASCLKPVSPADHGVCRACRGLSG